MKSFCQLLLVTIFLMALVPVTVVQGQHVEPKLGINLAGPADWNKEQPFVDVFRFSRQWISHKAGQKWGKGPALELDEHGWVKRLEPMCSVDTPLCLIKGGHFPSGKYTVLYQGKGKITFSNIQKVLEQTPGRIVIQVDARRGGIWLQIKEVDPLDYIRNIRVIMPGFENKYQSNPWRPDFLKRWAGFASLRFMDWMNTNNSSIVTWEDRPKITDASWTLQRGIPVEILCDLANRMSIDPWFCMPHQADDNYIRQFAITVKKHLDPKLKIYIEYSNETWNGMFEQNKYAGKMGQKLGLADKSWQAAWKYTGYRSIQIFKIWEEVFGGVDSLVRVLATQAVNPYVSGQIVHQNDAYKHADALAIAPYMSMNVSAKDADGIVALGLQGVLDRLENESLPRAVKSMQKQKAFAHKLGLELICYEAGQHMVGIHGGQNNQQLTQLFHAANLHPRMGQIYQKYFKAWQNTDGGLMAMFSSVGGWSKWGSWGLMRYADDKPMSQPKMQATLEQLRAWGKN
ncbi:MAG: hypothetical protein JKX85_02070 [Phycisphaeraceae bacterium]|nr:hypothetical protein [Phycisphaeraceae bacterium]